MRKAHFKDYRDTYDKTGLTLIYCYFKKGIVKIQACLRVFLVGKKEIELAD